MISFCVTTYNSVDTVDTFMKSFEGLDFPYEIIFVDNFSRDGTFEKLKKYERENISVIRRKCSRGMGRKIGIEYARYDYISILDVDVLYLKLNQKIKYLMENYRDHFVLCSGKDKGSLMSFFPKSLILLMGNFPDFNYGEDVYIWNIAKKIGKFVKDPEDSEFAKNIFRAEFASDISTERRYERGIIKLFIRRILITRDIIFIYRLNFKGLLEFYRIRNSGKKKIIAAILFAIGKVLTFSIRTPTSDEKADEILHKISSNEIKNE
ncbi:glycosyltransferase [Cuniculiplasma sp. SKW3]|uniref:glycosyltransferase n=1 Tax=Cuniculiplasma sp. SKW3 TaxID=3400170 RepID=UPI003FD4267D